MSLNDNLAGNNVWRYCTIAHWTSIPNNISELVLTLEALAFVTSFAGLISTISVARAIFAIIYQALTNYMVVVKVCVCV